MPYTDLNVVYNSGLEPLAHTLSFHHELGYNVVALSIPITGSLPTPLPTIPMAELAPLIPAGLKLLTRMTLTISDATQNHRVATLQQSYDLLALRPTTEKTFQTCCSSLECDLISLDFAQRLPFILRFTTVASALQRGVRFEICYSPGITSGNDARRNLISGTASLIRATRGRGIVISSEAKSALGVRAPADIINLAQVWGLSQERGKEAVCEEPGRVIKLAALKRTSYRGVVNIVDGGSTMDLSQVLSSRPSGFKDKEDNTTRPPPDKTRPATEAVLQTELPPLPETRPVNASKRKASSASLDTGQSTPLSGFEDSDAKRLSNLKVKLQAKKARYAEKRKQQKNHSG